MKVKYQLSGLIIILSIIYPAIHLSASVLVDPYEFEVVRNHILISTRSNLNADIFRMVSQDEPEMNLNLEYMSTGYGWESIEFESNFNGHRYILSHEHNHSNGHDSCVTILSSEEGSKTDSLAYENFKQLLELLNVRYLTAENYSILFDWLSKGYNSKLSNRISKILINSKYEGHREIIISEFQIGESDEVSYRIKEVAKNDWNFTEMEYNASKPKSNRAIFMYFLTEVLLDNFRL